jgi:hypothetical protein
MHGVDFTSRPSPRKTITIASGTLARHTFDLESVEEIADWEAFERWLRHTGPWIAGFDFPFGLPREAVVDLGWPQEWAELVKHCQALGREQFRLSLDRYRESRPAGRRYAHRAADGPARSHSPLKLVNPPVGLMFLEGAPRLLDAGVSVPGLRASDPLRIALETYPGFTARALIKGSYKNDATAKQTPARAHARGLIVAALVSGSAAFGFSLCAPRSLLKTLVRDGSGDRLDAVLCAMQVAWAWRRRNQNFGLPANVDPLEGWIATVPGG